MSKVLINEETKQLILDFNQQDAKNAYVFQNIADMLDNIKEGAEGIVICIALENYLKTEHPSLLRGASTGAVIKYCVIE